MPPCDNPCEGYPLRCFCVSILVLVDAALRHRIHRQGYHQCTCFNPWFSGCRPATLILHIDRTAIQSDVSILVLVDAALRHYTPRFS